MTEKDAVLFDVGDPIPAPPPPAFVEPPKPDIPDETEIMVFEPPLAGATFSEDNTHRFTLWRRFKSEGKSILFVGWNPSKATDIIDDNTVSRWISFAKRDGYALMMAGNVIPYRATDPDEMRHGMKAIKERDAAALQSIFDQNIHEILEMAVLADTVVLCCGNGGAFMGAFERVKSALDAAEIPLHYFGLTKPGYPKHALYLANSTPIIPYKFGALSDLGEDF